MRIALTGGSGGVGRAVADAALARGHSWSASIGPRRPAREHPRPAVHPGGGDRLRRPRRGLRRLRRPDPPGGDPAPGEPPRPRRSQQQRGGQLQRHARRRGKRCPAHLSGIERECHRSGLQPGAPLRLLPDRRGTTQSRRGRLQPVEMGLRAAGRRARPALRGLSIASLRFHWVLPDRAPRWRGTAEPGWRVDRHLWGYTRRDAAADACLRGVEARLDGHEVFYIVAPDTASDTPSRELAARHFPDVPIRGDLPGRSSFMTSAKAGRLLGWVHPGAPGKI